MISSDWRIFLAPLGARAAADTGDLIMGAVAHLALHPLVGRIAEQGLRELVISRGRSGYVALYRYNATRDAVIVLAIRHQREIDPE